MDQTLYPHRLVNELNHRVKNTLTTVQAIAAQTFRNGSTGDAPKRFENRLMALSRAHDVLTRESWEGADIADVVVQAIAPLQGDAGDRLHVSGPSVQLTPALALTMSIVLHELSTNASKYGALSNGIGIVDIDWVIGNPDTGRELKLNWSESGGPQVEAPVERGFGSSIIQRTLTREHDALVSLEFKREGLHCEIKVPLRS